ncbi:hypothetical protein ACWGJ2_14300 [Streptomyces sp. NPDC054796]
MGWTVLYIAFGIVALWLLGEVLLQYKARLRWRLLAFGGFLCVVVGALIPSVIVIGLGIAAFATGQTFVTLSYRRGFSTGWALGGTPGSSRRRREGPPAEAEPTLQVSGLEAYDPVPEAQTGSDATEDYASQGYGTNAYGADTYSPDAYATDTYGTDTYATDTYGYGNDAPGSVFQPAEPPVYQPAPLPDDTGEYGTYDTYAASFESGSRQGIYQDQAYGYDAQQQYASYTDPYTGYPSHDSYGGGVSFDPQGYIGEQQPYAPDPGGYDAQYGDYAQQPQQPYYSETPPGGVWVPQQRDPEAPLPPEQQPYDPYQPQPYPNDYDGYGNGQQPNGYYYDDQRGGY